MENEARILKKIYENSKTGMQVMSDMSERTYSEDFKALLFAQREKYHEIADGAYLQLGSMGELPDDVGVFSKLGVWTSLRMSNISSKREERMAETIINACTEGMIEITRFINNSGGISPASKALADKLIETERENIELMSRFL